MTILITDHQRVASTADVVGVSVPPRSDRWRRREGLTSNATKTGGGGPPIASAGSLSKVGGIVSLIVFGPVSMGLFAGGYIAPAKIYAAFAVVGLLLTVAEMFREHDQANHARKIEADKAARRQRFRDRWGFTAKAAVAASLSLPQMGEAKAG